MRNVYGLILTCGLVSCAATEHTADDQSDAPVKAEKLSGMGMPVENMEWVDYADPIADANLALEKNDVHLLAVSNKGLSLPGVDLSQHSLDSLQKACSVKLVATGGDAIYSKSQLDKRKSIVSYVKTYNQTVLAACLALIGD